MKAEWVRGEATHPFEEQRWAWHVDLSFVNSSATVMATPASASLFKNTYSYFLCMGVLLHVRLYTTCMLGA